MKEAQEMGQLLNQRQKLFNVPVVPWDDLNKLIREFEPYKNLWITASGWDKDLLYFEIKLSIRRFFFKTRPNSFSRPLQSLQPIS